MTPSWTCADCGGFGPWRQINYSAGDSDLECSDCESRDIRESPSEAALALGEKLERLRNMLSPCACRGERRLVNLRTGEVVCNGCGNTTQREVFDDRC